MKAYVKDHPECTLAEIIENTDPQYRRIDYLWDVERGSVRKKE
jgi:hypothetical protein